LPEPLRLVDPNAAQVEQEGDAGSLPEFLVDEEDEEAVGDEDPQQLDAAE